MPPKEKFYNKLKDEHITDEDYEFAKEMWKKWGCKTLRDYMKSYLKLDVCLLADCFEKFRKVIYEEYNLDPVYFLTGPSLAYQCALKYTGQKLEIISDSTKYNFIEKGIRGGYSAIHLRYAKANNVGLKYYNKNLPSSFLVCLDVNNLYGWAMSQNLPIGDFRWQDPEKFDIKKDCFVDVDLSIPYHLHDKLKDFPLCPTHEDGKLVATLYDKKGYICHSAYLRKVLSHGYVLEKVNAVLEFKSSPWLKPYIENNTKLRQRKENSKFEIKLWKDMNNCVYGKFIENLRERTNIKMVNIGELKEMAKKQTYKNYTILKNGLFLVEMRKESVTLNKPIYVGMSILDYSKIIMSDFWYNCLKKVFGDRVRLCMTDTDSFLIQVYTKDFYKELKGYTEKYLDTSHMEGGINRKVPGKFGNETDGKQIVEFCGLRSKQYGFVLENGEEKLKSKEICKQGMKSISFESYKRCLDGEIISKWCNGIRSRNHINYSESTKKLALNFEDTKRNVIGIDTLPWGYKY